MNYNIVTIVQYELNQKNRVVKNMFKKSVIEVLATDLQKGITLGELVEQKKLHNEWAVLSYEDNFEEKPITAVRLGSLFSSEKQLNVVCAKSYVFPFTVGHCERQFYFFIQVTNGIVDNPMYYQQIHKLVPINNLISSKS